ncbi:unnamed protein product [Caretta caretta]
MSGGDRRTARLRTGPEPTSHRGPLSGPDRNRPPTAPDSPRGPLSGPDRNRPPTAPDSPRGPLSGPDRNRPPTAPNTQRGPVSGVDWTRTDLRARTRLRTEPELTSQRHRHPAWARPSLERT